MSKEQTPITADQQTIKDLWNAKTADEISTILKKHTQAKVLKALEREFSKIPYIKHYNNGIVNTIGSKYYETEVKPNYKLK